MATSTNMTGELTADGSVIFLKASEKEARNVLEAFTDGRAGRSEGGFGVRSKGAFISTLTTVKKDSPSPPTELFCPNRFTQNLSAVLSDPGRSRSEVSTFFTRHWGDAFVPPSAIPRSTLIPPISNQQFAAHTKNTGKTYKRYHATKRAIASLQQPSACGGESDADDLPTCRIVACHCIELLIAAENAVVMLAEQVSLRRTRPGIPLRRSRVSPIVNVKAWQSRLVHTKAYGIQQRLADRSEQGPVVLKGLGIKQ
ncbi:unnamed protein product [Heligmosomoides polygyrus]|uniref:Uncharacterized protein n=1 Tax=Heligmosomoides polygyrus TaxID=6339 RepID=A0A183FER5_HELPZ|nr:unnamed protein product [Heligmosomoides polygyrus]